MARVQERRNAHRVLLGKPLDICPLGKKTENEIEGYVEMRLKGVLK
jgi:hypothetical protein